MIRKETTIEGKDGIKFQLHSFGSRESVPNRIFCVSDCITSSSSCMEVFHKSLSADDELYYFENRGMNPRLQDVSVELMIDDLEEVLMHIRVTHLDTPITIIGRGLGGLIALLYIEARKSKEVDLIFLDNPWLKTDVFVNKKTGFFKRNLTELSTYSFEKSASVNLNLSEHFAGEIQKKIVSISNKLSAIKTPVYSATTENALSKEATNNSDNSVLTTI